MAIYYKDLMEYKMKYLAASILFATILALSAYALPVYSQSEEVNQTLQDAGQAANQTGEEIQSEATDLGSNITEGAKNVVENIGEGLANLTK